MPASNKKVTKPTSAAAKIGKIATDAAAKIAASKIKHAAVLKRVAKATTKVLDKKPTAKRGPALLEKVLNKPLATARNAKPLTLDGKVVLPAAYLAKVEAGKASAKPAKPAKASAKPATDGVKAPTGAKATIIAMIERKDGASAAEVCKKLGWVKAGATIGRAIKLAPFKVRKERDGDGVLRYYRAEG